MANVLATNVGAVDRAARAIVGVALLSLVFLGPRTLWGVVGIVPLLTAAVGSCPLYTLLGITTCPVKAR